MKSFFPALLFLLSAFAGLAQQKLLDSLLVLEKSVTRDDSSAVSLYLAIANASQNVNPGKGLPYAAKAVSISRNLKDPGLLAQALAGKGTLHYLLVQYDEALASYRESLQINQALGDKRLIARSYNNLGLVHATIANHPKALDYYLKALQFNEELGNTAGAINNLGNIGNAFNALNEPREAIRYFDKALSLCDASTNPAIVGGLLNNLGNAYTALEDYVKALEYKLRALDIAEKSNNRSRIANSLGNLGNLYDKMGFWEKAAEAHRKALGINSMLKNKRGILSNYMGIAGVFFSTGQPDSSGVYFNRAYQLATEIGDVRTRAASLEKLSALYERSGKIDSSYLLYKQYIDLKNSLDSERQLTEIKQATLKYQFDQKEDSLLLEQLLIDNQLREKTLLTVQQQQRLRLQQADLRLKEADLKLEQQARSEKEKQLELAEKESIIQASQMELQGAQLEIANSEVQRQNTLRKFYLAGLALLGLLAALIYRNARFQKKTNIIIRDEKAKSDNLLLNILPAEVAEELKEKGSARARHFGEVSVLFTDFAGFTQVSETLSPEALVQELNECFSAFDRIAYAHGLEKIKTIGDAYMAVAGLPTFQPDHAGKAIQAALELADFIEKRRKSRDFGFEIRIGIHSGPVVAGIVGTRKFAYDIWGDTVNIAARMESSGAPGRVNVSEATYRLAKDRFAFEPRGRVQAKNKGEMEMYFVVGGVPAQAD